MKCPVCIGAGRSMPYFEARCLGSLTLDPDPPKLADDATRRRVLTIETRWRCEDKACGAVWTTEQACTMEVE